MHPQQLLLISLLPFLATAKPTYATRRLAVRDLVDRAESSSNACATISLKAKSYGRGKSDSEKIDDKEVVANGEGFFIGKETTAMCKKEGGEKLKRAESKSESKSSSYGKKEESEEEECPKSTETSIKVQNGKATMNAEETQQIYIDEEGKLLFSKAGEEFEEKEGTSEGFEYNSKTHELSFKAEEKEKSFWACPAEEEESEKKMMGKRAEKKESSEKESESEEKEEVWEIYVGEPQPKKGGKGEKEKRAEKKESEKSEKEEEFVGYKEFQKKKCYQVKLEGENVKSGEEAPVSYGEEEKKESKKEGYSSSG